MKKKPIKVALIVVAILVVLAIGMFLGSKLDFNQDDNELPSNNQDNFFIGNITKINGNTAIISVTEGENVLASSDKISVDISKYSFEKGDKVKVTFTGEIMETYPAKVNVKNIERVNLSKLTQLYITLIDDVIENHDVALNHNMEYVAIDINGFTNLNEKEKQDVINHLYKYSENVYVGNYEYLKEQGLAQENADNFPALKGILIGSSNTEKINDDKYVVNISKYRTGLGAIFPEYEATYKEGKWSFEIISMAIS